MSTLDYPSKKQHADILEQQADTLELELGLEIPVLEASNNELASLRSAYEAATSIRDDLQAKLKAAVEYSNEQAKIIDDIKDKPSEVDELKALLGKATERNNILRIDLQERDAEIQNLNDELTALRKNVSELEPLKTQLEHADEDNQVLSKNLQERESEVADLNEKISILQSKVLDTQELRAQLKQADSDNNLLTKSLEDQRIHLTTRIEELDSQIALLTSMKDEYERSSMEMKALKDALGHADNKIYQLTNEVEKHIKREAVLKRKIDSDKKSLQLYKVKVEAQEIILAELDELRTSLLDREYLHTELNQTIETERSRAQSLEVNLNEAQMVINTLQSKIEDANKQIPSLEQGISIRDEKISALDKELINLQKR